MSTFHCNRPGCWCRDTRFRATARDEMPETMEELADAEYIEHMREAEVDQATLDAGRDPDAVVEKALKSIEVSHD